MFYSYDVAERVLYRVPEIGTPQRQSHLTDVAETLQLLLADGVEQDDPFSKIEFLNGYRDDLKLVEQKAAKVTDGGRQWLDYSLTVRLRENKHPIQVFFRVDPETKLPHFNRVTGQHNGQAFSFEATFDYPETGPMDIYAIGVPREAKLVDRIPPDDVARLVAGVPNQLMEAVVDAHPADGPKGTVMLRVRRTGRVDAAPDPDADKRPLQPDEYRFWIDPAREYLVMRMDMMGDNDEVGSSCIVESVAQSPQGHWYPTRVRNIYSYQDVEDQIMEFHVDFDVNIPDALFEVKQPLSFEKVLHTESVESRVQAEDADR